MNKPYLRVTLALMLALIAMPSAHAQAAAASANTSASWARDSAGYRRNDGLFPIHVDAAGGRVFLQLPAAGSDGIISQVIHHTVIKEGVGSAVTRLDRAQFGPSRLLTFRRVGGKVLAEYSNPAIVGSGSPQEAAAADAAFADSAVWAGDVVSTLPGGELIVDISGFLTRDAWGMLASLNRAGQGTFRQSADLTMVDPAGAHAFPDNLELDALFTFTSDNPGRELANVTPDPRTVTVTLRHSLIRLPEPGYVPRRFDPRAAQGELIVTDFSAPLQGPMVTRLARRFRLEKTDPTAARSTVKEPIVFYVDNSAPEPIRTALVEGAMWWADAFEAAGFIDAYRVEVLPDHIDPLDARYNVIFWVHRMTRGWSHGQSVTDPRTGEIVRGSVLLGSQRIRQNIIMFESMLSAAASGRGGPNDPVEIALARARQLSAHEVGHALGFQHNFAASTQDRSSVMDYPVPLVRIVDGELDFGDAYAVGIGAWDSFTVDALYGDERGLQQRIAEGAARLRFRADIDGRADSTGNPLAGSWDNGSDPVAELNHIMRVRRIALDRFGLRNLHPGMAVFELRRRVVPVYLYHRYQVSVTASLIGGADYAFPVNGDGVEASLVPVPLSEQRAALEAMLATLRPAELVFSPQQLQLLAAQNTGASDPQFDVEIFGGRGGRFFDPGMAAEVAAEITLAALLAPERLNRLVDAAARDSQVLTLDGMLDTVLSEIHSPTTRTAAEAEAARRVQLRTALMLARHLNGVPLGTTPGAVRPRESVALSSTAAAVVSARIDALGTRLKASRASDPVQRAHDHWLGQLLTDRDALDALLASGRYDIRIPPGEPI